MLAPFKRRTYEVKPCLHFGLPKTATTWLQDHVFAKHSQIDYLGAYHIEEKKPFDKWRDPQIHYMMDQLLYTRLPNLGTCKKYFKQHVAPSMAEGIIPIWSKEAMALSMRSNRKSRAENLRKVFGDCHVLIMLRSPVSLVKSVYFQVLKKRNLNREGWGKPPFVCNVDQLIQEAGDQPGVFINGHLDYANTIDMLANVYGKNAVKVMLFEDLLADQAGFLDSLCQLLGIDAEEAQRLGQGQRRNDRWTVHQIEALKHIQGNASLSQEFQASKTLRRREMLGLPASHFESPQGPRAVAEISLEAVAEIENRTRQDNRRLVQEWDLPLEQYDYPL